MLFLYSILQKQIHKETLQILEGEKIRLENDYEKQSKELENAKVNNKEYKEKYSEQELKLERLENVLKLKYINNNSF